jgi:hypothetical protein
MSHSPFLFNREEVPFPNLLGVMQDKEVLGTTDNHPTGTLAKSYFATSYSTLNWGSKQSAKAMSIMRPSIYVSESMEIIPPQLSARRSPQLGVQ